jgi:UDP:flavonoid glycosyltransferase YjiC (YdhE family)
VFARTERNYEPQITAAGFEARQLDFHLDEETVTSIMTADHEGNEFVTHLPTARRYIGVLLDEMAARRPDLVVFGFVPPAGIAAQVLGVPSVAYLPFPAHGPWVRRHLVKDVPDQLENALTAQAPRPLRRALAGLLSRVVTTKRFFTQPTFAAAGRELGWRAPRGDLFAMLGASVQLVNDLPGFYQDQDVGPRTRITGPLFSRPPAADVDPRIREMLAKGRSDRVFVSMGSSGEKSYLLEAIAAVASMQVRAVVVVPPRICSLAEVQGRLRVPAHVHLTDAFVPAHQVNAMADAAVIHGGQGTVQTAVHAGTPIVGVGMQVEQSTNIDNVVHRGAGIRIARGHWDAERIRRALHRVLHEPSFRQSALRLSAEHRAIDGRREAGRAMWEVVDAHGL